MVLWFPVFLAGVVGTGLSIQRGLRRQGVNVPQFTYLQALRLSPTALFGWLAVTGVGSGAALIATYPEYPTSLGGWLLVTCPWYLCGSSFRGSGQSAGQKSRPVHGSAMTPNSSWCRRAIGGVLLLAAVPARRTAMR
jgi:hypothetical protein